MTGGALRRASARISRALESLYRAAPINQLFQSRLEIVEAGVARIHFIVDESVYHAAGAAHGTIYFKMLDDAAFYAANSLVSDRFMLTTAFNLLLTRPIKAGPAVAEGRWVSGKRRVMVADAHLLDAERRGGRARHRHLHALAFPALVAARLRRRAAPAG